MQNAIRTLRDRSNRWPAYGPRELRFPPTFKTHQLTLDVALAQLVILNMWKVGLK